MTEYIIHYKDAETLYEHTDFPFLLEEYLREEIVRCRDCTGMVETWDGYECERFSGEYHRADPDGYCKWGERRGE